MTPGERAVLLLLGGVTVFAAGALLAKGLEPRTPKPLPVPQKEVNGGVTFFYNPPPSTSA